MKPNQTSGDLCQCADPRPLVQGAACRRCHRLTPAVAHIDLSALPHDTYVSFAQVGECKVCGKEEDLRMGACYDCADVVDGRQIPGGHELWDSRNPEVKWYVREQ